MTQSEIFKKLAETNVNDNTEKKNGLTYLSWAWAWQKFKEVCPNAFYEIKRFGEDNLPYVFQKGIGFMVFTSITVPADDGALTHEMWLPVMDGANRAMLDEEYTCRNKTVGKADMFDVNKTIMRCLTKNISMFGLGLYIYAGEDLPTEIDEPITAEQIEQFNELGVNIPNTLRYYNASKVEELTKKQAQFVISSKQANKAKEGKDNAN